MDTKNLHWPEINPPRLLWIEGSPGPHKAKGHHELGYIGRIMELYQEKGKGRPLDRRLTSFSVIGNCGKEACGSPSGRLMKQMRGRCPHILALTNSRIALRAWREDSCGITRLLLATIADSLARQGARMSDTITLCTRILLTTQDLHSKRMDHGGSGEVRAWEGRKKRNIAE